MTSMTYVLFDDRNNAQVNRSTDQMMGLKPMAGNRHSIDWTTHDIDGHNSEDVRAVFRTALDLNGGASPLQS